MVDSIKLTIESLKSSWYKWVEYLRPVILLKMKQHNVSLNQFRTRHFEMIVEISKDFCSPDGNAANSALNVHKRITANLNTLKEMGETNPYEMNWMNNYPTLTDVA